jgi:hypothetical protein
MLLLRSIAFPLDEPGTTPGRHACLLIGPITIARILGRQGEQDRRCTLRAEEPEREEGARKGRRSQKGEEEPERGEEPEREDGARKGGEPEREEGARKRNPPVLVDVCSHVNLSYSTLHPAPLFCAYLEITASRALLRTGRRRQLPQIGKFKGNASHCNTSFNLRRVTMTSAEGQRIQTYCEIIWGKGDYDVDVETDDWETYYGVVKRDFGTELDQH